MDDPVVLRGLLQAVVLTLYFAVRYLLDVVFTPRAVQAASHKVLNVVFFAWHASWATPIASLVALQLWSSVGYGTLVRWGLRGCVVRGIWATLMDNSIVVAGLTKRQVWVPVLWWAEFTRISSGRVAPHGPWTAGPGRALCCVAPWAVRVAVLAARRGAGVGEPRDRRGERGRGVQEREGAAARALRSGSSTLRQTPGCI